MSKSLPILPLTKQGFAAFGDVIEPDQASMRLINSGTTERYHGLAKAEAIGEGARVILNIFRGQARSFPYLITMMERHPFGSQSFSPLSQKPFLVVVSQDENGTPGEPKVFLAANGQGVNYHANVWHHPLMSLGETSDFLVVDREGPGHNLEEYFFADEYIIEEPSL